MSTVLDWMVLVGVPLLLLTGMILAIAWPCHARWWLPLSAALALALLILWSLVRILPYLDSQPRLVVSLVLVVLAAASAVLLAVQGAAMRRGGPVRAWRLTCAFALTVPLIVLLLLVALSAGAGGDDTA
jgi:hypothetical protein